MTMTALTWSRTRRSLLLAALALLTLQGAAAAEGLTLRVNVPAYRLDVFRDGERIRSYETAIGKPSHPTPLGAWSVTSVEWNPWWNPPDSPWAKGAQRTPPGPSNPMGRAKINFLPLYYVHGSAAPLGRAVSHGCIRVSNQAALELARLIAHEAGADIRPSQIDALERSPTRTRQVRVPGRVRIEVVYRLTEEIDGQIRLYDDVYGRGLTAQDRERKRRLEQGR